MIKSSDVPRYLKDSVPSYAGMIDEHVRDLGEAVNYPLVYDMLLEMIERLRVAPSADDDIVRFFGACEQLLTCGDPSTQDLIALEVIETLAQPDMEDLGLCRVLGKVGQAELERFRSGLDR